jgi:hypothetical protein
VHTGKLLRFMWGEVRREGAFLRTSSAEKLASSTGS